MLADVLTMLDHAAKPVENIAYCYVGDARNNTANSLLVTGALLGADVRLAAPESLWPVQEVRDIADRLAAASGARLLVTDELDKAVQDVDFLYTDVWLSMGEPEEKWGERIDQAPALPAQCRCSPDDRKSFGQGSALSSRACTTERPRSERWSSRRWGLEALESHRGRLRIRCFDRLRPGRESIAHHQGRHGLNAWRLMRIVVALGGNALLERGDKPDAEIQEHHIEQAVTALAPLCREHEVVITHGNGPQVGLLALESGADPALTRARTHWTPWVHRRRA